MAQTDSSRDIDQAAAGWAARLDRGPLTPGDQTSLQAWLKDDPRARGALLRAQAAALASESARGLGVHFDPRAFEPTRSSRLAGLPHRRGVLLAGGALSAASVLTFGVGVSTAGAVSSTERGEIRLVPLKDGSTVLLNTQSMIRVHYGKAERTVTLMKGEAYVSVARDARPFILRVDGHRLRATQAAFRVRKLDGQPVDILVSQGRVDVAQDRGPTSGDQHLPANTRLALSQTAAERPLPVAPELVTRELAWREGKLAFEGETLQQAADAFARYSDVRIQIADPALAREPVTGLFAANDPAGFCRAVARVFDARLQAGGRKIVVSRAS